MADLRAPLGLRRAWRDKWLLGAAFALLWRARIELYVTGFGDPLKGCTRTSHLPAPSPTLAARVAWSVDRAALGVMRPTCLVRAMAGQRLLAMKGYGSRISVGVRHSGEAGLEAHAWLSAGETIILGNRRGQIERFSPLIGAS